VIDETPKDMVERVDVGETLETPSEGVLEASQVISPLTGKLLPAPTKRDFMQLAPKKPMNAKQQASEDGLQRLIAKAQGAS
jgi:hypothetical protein